MDPNGHINNVAYLAWALEVIPEHICQDYQLNEVSKLSFLAGGGPLRGGGGGGVCVCGGGGGGCDRCAGAAAARGGGGDPCGGGVFGEI